MADSTTAGNSDPIFIYFGFVDVKAFNLTVSALLVELGLTDPVTQTWPFVCFLNSLNEG
jgi:hypothetical protein